MCESSCARSDNEKMDIWIFTAGIMLAMMVRERFIMKEAVKRLGNFPETKKDRNGAPWEWSTRARLLIGGYPAMKCANCKNGGCVTDDYVTSGGQHALHLKIYCQTMSSFVFDNANPELARPVRECDFFEDEDDSL